MDVFEFLRKSVPRKERPNGCFNRNSVEKLRKEIIGLNRTISLFLLSDDCINRPFDKGEYDVFLNSLNNSGVFIGVSQISQNANFVLTFVLDNLEIFVEVIMNKFSSPNFREISQEILPPLFSFFASDEDLDTAAQFYSKTIERFRHPIENTFPSFVPFFRCGALFRFVENSSSLFFQRFMIDSSDPKSSQLEQIVSVHSSFILECYSLSFSLMPRQHLDVLRRIHESTNPKAFIKFLLDDVLFPLTEFWLGSVAFPSDLLTFRKIIDQAHFLKDDINNMINSMLQAHAIIQPPRLYERGEDGNHLLVFSVKQIIHIAELLDEHHLLPPFLDISEFKCINPRIHGTYFWSEVFSSGSKEINFLSKTEPLIFRGLQHMILDDTSSYSKRMNEMIHYATIQDLDVFEYSIKVINERNDEFSKYCISYLTNMLISQAAEFEEEINNRLFYSQLEKWYSILYQYKMTIVSHRVICVVDNSHKIKAQGVYKNILSVYNDPQTMQLLYLLELDRIVPKVMSMAGSMIRDLEIGWNKLQKEIISKGDFPHFGKFVQEKSLSIREIIWNSIKQMRCTHKLPFFKKLSYILKGVSQILPIADSKSSSYDTIAIILQQIHGEIIVPAYLIIDPIAMKNPKFISLFENNEQIGWLKLESAILKCLKQNIEFFTLFLAVHEMIFQKFSCQLNYLFER